MTSTLLLLAAWLGVARAEPPEPSPPHREGVALMQLVANGYVAAPWKGGEPTFPLTAGFAAMIRPSKASCFVVRPSIVAGASVDLDGHATPLLQTGVTAGCVLVPDAVQLTAGFALTVRFPADGPATLAPPGFPILLAFPVHPRVFPALVVTPSPAALSAGLQLVVNLAKVPVHGR